MDEAACRTVYEFGGFRLDAGRRVLCATADETRIRIAPKVFDTAHYLVEHAGELLSKARLLTDLWPGIVVEENSLTQAISELRRALGEVRGDHRYVVTVPRRGYQFVAEVSRVSAAPLPPFPPERIVAVLPLDNVGHAVEFEMLSTGIPEAILHRLGAVAGIQLACRDSSFACRGPHRDARAIGRMLGARYLIEGVLQHFGSRLRVTVQLTDAVRATHVWSLMFDGAGLDVFAIEDEVSKRVARAVRRTLRVVALESDAAATACRPTSRVSSVARAGEPG